MLNDKLSTKMDCVEPSTVNTIFSFKGGQDAVHYPSLFLWKEEAHIWTKLQKLAKNEIKKFVKKTDHTCARNGLTNFECRAQTGNRKRKLYKFSETCMEKFVKSLWVNLFWADFSFLEPPCVRSRSKDSSY